MLTKARLSSRINVVLKNERRTLCSLKLVLSDGICSEIFHCAQSVLNSSKVLGPERQDRGPRVPRSKGRSDMSRTRSPKVQGPEVTGQEPGVPRSKGRSDQGQGRRVPSSKDRSYRTRTRSSKVPKAGVTGQGPEIPKVQGPE